MNLAQLEAMVAVVDYGSFTAAADVLRISQPSLSRRIRALEETLGADVFTPSGRRMVLTDLGTSLLGPARRMLREANAVAAIVTSAQNLIDGALRVAGLPSLVSTVVPEYVGRFHRAHPGIRLEVFGVEDVDELFEAVRLARADVAFGVIGRVPDDLAVAPAGDQDFMAVLPGDGPVTEPARVDAAMLASHTLVTLPRGTSIRSVADSVYSTFGISPPDIVTTTQRDALVPLSLAGTGLTIVPSVLARQAEALGGRIASFPETISRPLGLIYRREDRRSPALARFLELASLIAGEKDGSAGSGRDDGD